MKFLFIIQGEGRGHMTQALSLQEILKKNGHEISAVMVGKNDRRELPDFFIKKIKSPIFKFASPNFSSSKKIRASIWKSLFVNLTKIPAFIKSIFFIRKKIKESDVDVIINFYDFLAGLSNFFFSFKKPFICLGNQYTFFHPDFEFPPKESIFQIKAMNLFSKITCLRANKILAFSLKKMSDYPKLKIKILPPLLRKEVFLRQVKNENYFSGYLLNHFLSEKVEKYHKKRLSEEWHFFWDKKNVEETEIVDKTLFFHKLNNELFLDYLSSSRGFVSTAGFESICEAMYFEKPIAMTPTHIEQACNAYEVEKMGAGIVLTDFDLEKFINYLPNYKKPIGFKEWVESGEGKILAEIESIFNKN